MMPRFLLGLFLSGVLRVAACNPAPPVPPPVATHNVAMMWGVVANAFNSSAYGLTFFLPAAKASSTVIGYTVWRAPCAAFVPVQSGSIGTCSSEGAFANILPSTPLTEFSDSQVSAGLAYSYYVTANYSDGSSADSNHAAALIP
jgi:hypothetical protein